jgi:hypothetical protein
MKKFVATLILLLFAVNSFSATIYTVKPSLSLSEEYNDNLFLTQSDRISDFISYVSPGIDLSAKSINTILNLSYTPTFSFYSSHNDLNETAHNINANGTFTLSDRLSSNLTGSYVRSSETNDIRAIPDIGPVTVRTERQYLAIGGGASYKLRDNLFYTLGLTYANMDTDAPDLNKVKTYSGNMGFAYETSERTTLSANAMYMKYDYKPARDWTEQYYSLVIKHRLSQTVTIAASGGTIIIKTQDRGESDIDIGGGVDLTKTFETGKVSLSYGNNVIPSVESSTPLRAQTVSLHLSKSITNKLAGSVSAYYTNYKSVGTTIDANKMDVNEIVFTPLLTYTFSQAVNLILSYSYVNSSDKIDSHNDFHNNIVLLTLRLTYSKKL